MFPAFANKVHSGAQVLLVFTDHHSHTQVVISGLYFKCIWLFYAVSSLPLGGDNLTTVRWRVDVQAFGDLPRESFIYIIGLCERYCNYRVSHIFSDKSLTLLFFYLMYAAAGTLRFSYCRIVNYFHSFIHSSIHPFTVRSCGCGREVSGSLSLPQKPLAHALSL